ncbi:hypothetical protein [Rubritalea tangerina]
MKSISYGTKQAEIVNSVIYSSEWAFCYCAFLFENKGGGIRECALI